MERKRRELLDELSYLRDRLEKTRQLFDFSDDDDETESLIYEEKAILIRYSKALKEAKELGITALWIGDWHD